MYILMVSISKFRLVQITPGWKKTNYWEGEKTQKQAPFPMWHDSRVSSDFNTFKPFISFLSISESKKKVLLNPVTHRMSLFWCEMCKNRKIENSSISKDAIQKFFLSVPLEFYLKTNSASNSYTKYLKQSLLTC